MAIGSKDDSGSGQDDFYSLYDAKEVLGTGMSSVVRRCVDKRTNQEYAAKIFDVSTERATEEQAAELRESVLAEIAVMKLVAGHPNIIELHDCFETPTFLFIVLEICKGGELFDYLTRWVSLSEKKTRSIMRQLLYAVKAMHDQKIVHRDLKPENILLVDDEAIKLTDFGFAYKLRDGEQLTELVGTPGYLAPEVLKKSMYDNVDGYDEKVDLWACGVIMYTLLCGYAPFYHKRQIYMLRLIAEGNYEFRSPEWDEISEDAKDLIRHFLVVEPTERYSADQALSHPFLVRPAAEDILEMSKHFSAKKRFRLAIIQVRSLVRMLRIRHYPQPITAQTARVNPYSARKLRKHIDACAFQVYGHWIKKGREQYRDMLFANAFRSEVRSRHVSAK